MDAYADVRSLPLQAVVKWLGITTEWKERKGGTELTGPCPICKPKSNRGNFSFTNAIYHCFSCGAKGKGAIDLVIAVKGCNFTEAVEFLRGFDLQRDWASLQPVPRLQLLQVVENEPFKATYEKFYVESQWLSERGFTPETLKRYGVGQYDNPKRQSVYKGKILFPITRWDGQCVGYLARDTRPLEERGSDPKYIFPKGFHKHLELFGAWQLKNDVKPIPLRIAYVVESPLCVMKFSQLGFPAVSPFGWSLSVEQVKMMRLLARGWIYLPDKNKSNDIAESLRNLSAHCWVKSPELPADLTDPEQMSAEQIASLTGV